MNRENLGRLITIIGSLHLALFAFAFGSRHGGYILAAIMSGALTWGLYVLLDARNILGGAIISVVLGLIAQQVAYQYWKVELPGFWWPLAQFGALQFLIAYGISQAVQ
jgi:hypothetical protein